MKLNSLMLISEQKAHTIIVDGAVHMITMRLS